MFNETCYNNDILPTYTNFLYDIPFYLNDEYNISFFNYIQKYMFKTLDYLNIHCQFLI